MELKEKIKNYRIENKLTQQKLADRLNVSRTLIAETESGKIKGTVKFLSKLADLSGKTISYWMDVEVEKNYKIYESLDVLITAMMDSGMIKEDNKIPEDASKLINAVLEKEVALKRKNSNKRR
ncbi:helix-turn-helix transcriptional regulator [Clostridium estertheticum]|uniref:helix-turn-helix transcriptional regulator n=1 Tax=Clostridium estertheticum TaxID=238834 RepID=UPI0013EE92A6|nr:helix-turn-helix transcriptional regulator [Clostridium estertheticum]MBZ9608676.1 helix-turn-helix transcriptional regulator [Clostridium estertheticum]